MSTVTTKAIAKVAAVATGLAMATSMLSLAPMAHAASLTSAQVQSILSLLSSFGADSATIANVQSALTGSPVTSGSTTTTTSSSCSFTKDLTMKSSGAEVTCLQKALIAGGFSIPAGATGYFGGQTQTAVIAWQKSAGVSPASGYFGAISRAHWNLGGTSSTGGSTGGTGTVVTGNGLKVSLAPTSPNGSVLVQGQGIGNLGDFVFSNPTSAPVNVTGVTFNRIGVSNDSTMTNVYLYNNGTRITDSAGVSNGQFSWNDANGIFTVPAGGTYTVSVRSDIAGSTSGQQIGVSLVSVSSTGTLDSSVSFPIMSGYQTISAANLATVTYGANTTPSTTTISPQNDYPVWQNTISVSTNAVKLQSMRFTNLGSIDGSYLTNLRLYVDGTQVGSAVASMASDRTVTFDLSSAPVLLSTQSHTIKVLANITGGASRTVEFSVQRASDAMYVDNQLSQPVTPVNSDGSAFTAQSSGTVTINSVSGSTGVSVSRDAGSPTQNVAVGASNVDWADFDMLASGENTKINDLYVFADTSIHNGGLKNGKIMVNGVQVGSTKDIGELSANKTDYSLGSSLILPAGQTTKVSVYADAKTSTSTNLSNNETVTVSLYGASNLSNAQGQSSLQSANVPSSNTSGQTITVSSSSLTATKYTGYGNQTVIAGSNNAKLGAFTLSTGSTEGVTVNTVVLTTTTANAASITNLTLKDDATGQTLGTIITTPSTSNSFAVNFDIPASSTKTVDVYANVLSGANNGSVILTVDSTTGGVGDTTGTAASVGGSGTALQTITVGTGTLSVAVGANYQTSTNVLAGASAVNVGEFTFTGSNSAYTVNNLAILIPNGVARSVTNVTLSYKDANGAAKKVTQALANSGSGNATATFTGLGMYVPTNDSANLDVSVGTPTIASGANSGDGIQVTLDTGATAGTFLAQNSAGSTVNQVNTGTAVASNGTFYVRKSIASFAMIPTGLTVPASGSPLYKFSITADPAGAIEWSKLTFNVSTTSATVTNVYITDDSSGTDLLTASNYATTTSGTISIDLKNNGTTAYQQIAAGTTKTYDLYGNVSGFTTGSTVTISLAADTHTTTNDTAANVAGSTYGNIVWSDRSATTHSTGSSDWTNGYLLQNFTSSAQSYSK
jgi:trimeric autotransporter adhesin